MQRQKKKYLVVFGKMGDSADGSEHFDFKNEWERETIAVSIKQAINNAKFRLNEETFEDVYGIHDQGQENWYAVYVSAVYEETYHHGKIEWMKVYPEEEKTN